MTKGFVFQWKGLGTGWIVTSPFYMNAFEVLSACSYVLKVQQQRLRALPFGSRRDDLLAAIEELKRCKITQRIVPETDSSLEINLFKANKLN